MQVLQAANTGITSLQKLVDSAKSVANQALQSDGRFLDKVERLRDDRRRHRDRPARHHDLYQRNRDLQRAVHGAAGGTTAAVVGTTLGGISASLAGTAATAGDGTTALTFAMTLSRPRAQRDRLVRQGRPTDGETLTVNGKTITFKSGSVPAEWIPAGSGVPAISSLTAMATPPFTSGPRLPRRHGEDLVNAIDLASGVQKAVNAAGAAAISNSSGTKLRSPPVSHLDDWYRR